MLLGLTGCGKEPLGGTAGKDIKTLPVTTVPKTMAGLTVKQEKITKALAEAENSYVDAVGFFSLRKEKIVQGTLQISRFGPDARIEDDTFRRQIVQQSSPGAPTTVNVAGASIDQSSGTKSTVSVWFSKGRFVILTVLATYTGARGLLEQALVALPAT